MQILHPKFILTPDKILSNHAVAFDSHIQAVAPKEELVRRFPDAALFEEPSAVVMPGFANPHLHLEFSANKATLSYGDFIPWLYSLIEHREELLPKCQKECMTNALRTLLIYGTTAIGAISSYGEDIEACAKSPLKVQLFNEIIGSNPAGADVMYASFLERFHRCKKLQNDRFKAAVAIHSPYSVHYVLAKRAIEIAKRENALVSTHFMESRAEREWLDMGTGEFAHFFKKLLGQSRPVNNPLEFLELFEEVQTLFVHMVWANEQELAKISRMPASIVHCPISNRLLGNGVLDLERIAPTPYTLATDGLSSNYTLNLYEELKAALFLHPNKEATNFAKELIVRSTKGGYKALGFEGGVIEEGMPADLQIVSIPEDLKESKDIYLHLIVHTQKPKAVYIQGVNHV